MRIIRTFLVSLAVCWPDGRLFSNSFCGRGSEGRPCSGPDPGKAGAGGGIGGQHATA